MTYRVREITLRRPISVLTKLVHWPDVPEGSIVPISEYPRITDMRARLPSGRYFIVEELHKVWAFNIWRRSSEEYHINRDEAELEIKEIKRRDAEEYRVLMACWSRSKKNQFIDLSERK